MSLPNENNYIGFSLQSLPGGCVFKDLNDLKNALAGWITGMEHSMDGQHGPACNIDYYNAVIRGSNSLGHILTQLSNVPVKEQVNPKQDVIVNSLVALITSEYMSSESESNFKNKLREILEDYDYIQKKALKGNFNGEPKDLPF